ncbi:hypothetical protein J6590_016530 [Homalodisca vitripennis]|nr:hypothetical protein J6590_016530 [Homalodisca vitripennis]
METYLGDVSEKICSASIKTDPNITALTVCNKKHSSEHPVTMRSLLSPLSRTRYATDAALPTPPASDSPPACSTSGPDPALSATPSRSSTSISSPAGETTAFHASTGEKPTPVAATKPDLLATTNSLEVPTPVASSGASDADELASKNCRLKDQIRQLNVDLMRVVDHSIESDTRLLRYTNDIFVARSSLSGVSAGASVRDCAVQCEPPVTTCCQVSQCSETRDLRLNVYGPRGRSRGVPVATLRRRVIGFNRFEPLENTNEKPPILKTIATTNAAQQKYTRTITCNNSKPFGQHPPPKSSPGRRPKLKGKIKRELLSFRNVVIEGDSNTRFLACIVQRRVSSAAKVTGICKPGAKLLNVTSSSPSPPSSCFILLARTNDIAAGESHNIYNRLEERVTVRLSSADVILAMIPYLHDLFVSHPEKQRTILANYYIEELCVRHSNLKLLDINDIGRNWFTRWHASAIARAWLLLSDRLLRLMPPASPAAADTCESLASPAQNRLMQHDTSSKLLRL